MPKLLTIRKGTMVKTVTPYSWDLMGPNKNGWELAESSDQVVANEAAPVSRGKNPVVVDAGPVVNEVQPVADQVVANEVTNDVVDAGEVSNEINSDFLAEAMNAKLKPGVLKDYCDINGIAYKQKDKPETLIEKIGEFLGYDIEKFKSEFGI